jgi:1-deoxy-D-xylulose 5-phosphate reductoisomerase
VFNAANQQAVALFLDGQLGLTGIAAAIDDALQTLAGVAGGTRDALLEADAAARRRVLSRYGG